MNANSPNKYQDFYGRDYTVTPDVLIPRPETEQLIDAVLNLAGKSYLPGVKPSKRRLPKKFQILDVGTGSGCIAVTIKKELPEADVAASDISETALKVAKQNAKNHKAEITFLQSNLLDEITFDPDVIVANLPYVDPTWDWIDKKALSREPEIALYAEDHGLAVIKQLANQVATRNIKYLILEADPCQHHEIIKYTQKAGFVLVETREFILTFCKHQVSH